ncbi:MAG: right-handed parallel beta-helix repeat-containing protein, partial [Panacibacter sp.]
NWDACEHKGEQGISVISGSGITITNNKIEGAIDDAIATHGNCSDVTITGNTITTIRGRLLLNGITNGVVKNNTIEYLRNGWTAILITMSPDLPTVSTNNNLLVEGNTIHVVKGVSILAPIMLYAPGSNVTITNNTINSEDVQSNPAIQLAERRINKVTKTYYFGDNIHIYKNNINNFSSGVKVNITSKVKAPKIDIDDDNNITNYKQKVLRETGDFILRVPDDNESN